MSTRPKQQLLQTSPEASLTASTSPSIASTVPMASPSVRRSAWTQDSPSVSYRNSLRNSVMRDTCTPIRQLMRRRSRSKSRSRIFGLDGCLGTGSSLTRIVILRWRRRGHHRGPAQATAHDQSCPSPHLSAGEGRGSQHLAALHVGLHAVGGGAGDDLLSCAMGPLTGLRM